MSIKMRDMILKSGSDDSHCDNIKTEICYLSKESKHENEKPYEMRYDPGREFPRTNMSNDFRSVTIRNFRQLQDSQSFEKYGFTAIKVDCSMTASEFDDEEKVYRIYYPEIEELLHQIFPDAVEIKILEHGIRKRHDEFGTKSQQAFETAQPATAVHIDYSPYSAHRTAWALNANPDQYRRLLTVNVWKPLRGGGNDWPLAFCDSRTIDHTSECIVADVVFPNRFTENVRLYYSPKHEWYYFKDLMDDEVIIFRQTDSALDGAGGVAHASFYNPKADRNAVPRASIEVRAYVFY
ncbi:hypothetical protein K449DRAFT_438935 [Hypoxylon sp. EC38]|nr:hypothetical protein K449DRAFT_438935 [Hypoxylon sp. EC38]